MELNYCTLALLMIIAGGGRRTEVGVQLVPLRQMMTVLHVNARPEQLAAATDENFTPWTIYDE